ncbi:hypothetical protein MMC26_001211 [Xylographa opegraphella]|nr:hypothetical protein [Xylographa opegraphella]
MASGSPILLAATKKRADTNDVECFSGGLPFKVIVYGRKHFGMSFEALAHLTIVQCYYNIEPSDIGCIADLIKGVYDTAESPTGSPANKVYRRQFLEHSTSSLPKDELSFVHDRIVKFSDENEVKHDCKFCTGDAPHPECGEPSAKVLCGGVLIDRVQVGPKPPAPLQFSSEDSLWKHSELRK